MDRKPARDNGPFAFAAAEAMAQGAAVGIVAWEAGGAFHYRTIPDNSLAVLTGVHELLALSIDAVRQADDADDPDDPA